MKLPLLAAFFLTSTTAVATAQVVPVAPFQGAYSDGFEAHAPQQGEPCVVQGVFGDRADLCANFGATVQVTGGLPGTVQPHAGALLFHTDVQAQITFAQPARRFGAWFASEWVTGGYAYFFDPAGNPLNAHQFNMQACSPCGWIWNGWEVSGNVGMGQIVFDTWTGTGGHFQLDDMEVAFVCDGTVSTYCTPKPNSLGCVPALSTQGQPSASYAEGFTVRAANVRNQKPGLLLYGVSGRAAVPFQGGFLCIAAPVRRTVAVDSGGSALPAQDCSGVWQLDMNAFAAGALGGNPLAALKLPGTTVDCQWWGRDPGFAPPNNTALSAGIEYSICP